MILKKKWSAIALAQVTLGCVTAPQTQPVNDIDLNLRLLNNSTSKITQSKDTQSKDTQSKDTQSKDTQSKDTQSKDTQSKDTQPSHPAVGTGDASGNASADTSADASQGISKSPEVSHEAIRLPDDNDTLVHNHVGPSLASDAAEMNSAERQEEEKQEVEVEELSSAQTPESETIEEDSELSPEAIGEIVSRNGPIESVFALCEDSVYMKQWESDFDKNWLAENHKRYRRPGDRNKALNAARAQAFVSLVFPTIGNVSSDYPVVINRDVLNWIEYFQTRGRKAMVTWLKRGEDVIPVAAPVLEKNGLPRDLVYLSMIESGFNNRALSVAAAVGPWQFIRSTGKLYGLRIDDFVDERRDPARATEAAANYLSDLYASLGDWHLAAASYNAGEGRIRGAKRKSIHDDFFSLSRAHLLPNETRNYVPKLIAALLIGKNPGKFGFEVAQGSRAIAQTTIKLTRPLALVDIAREANIDLRLLESMNPELRHGVTPPPTAFRPFFNLKVPATTSARVESTIANLPDASLHRTVAGSVNRKDTAGNFAARLGVPLAEFLKANSRITARTKLTKGQMVMIPITLGTGQYDKLTASQSKKSKNKGAGKSGRKSRKSRKSKSRKNPV